MRTGKTSLRTGKTFRKSCSQKSFSGKTLPRTDQKMENTPTAIKITMINPNPQYPLFFLPSIDLDVFFCKFSAPSPPQWACHLCTFLNQPSITVCEMCETRRKPEEPSLWHETRPEVPSLWHETKPEEPSLLDFNQVSLYYQCMICVFEAHIFIFLKCFCHR